MALGLGCATTGGEGQGSIVQKPARRPSEAANDASNSDGVAMAAERGSLDREEAEGAIASRFDTLKRCYEEAGDAMAFASGTVMLRFDVAVDGRTLGVSVLQSRLGNYAVERCLSQAGQAIRFPRPHGNGRATFEYSLEFRSSEERAVVDLPSDVAIAVRPALVQRLYGDCNAQGLGEMEATLYLDRRGQVHSAGLAAKLPIAAASAACAVGSLARAPIALPTAVPGDALGRLTVAVTSADLVAAAAAPVNVALPSAARSGKDRLAARSRRRR